MINEQLARSLRTRSVGEEDLRAKCVLANVAQQLFGDFSEVQIAGKRFAIRRKLGAGAMGVVYEVEPARSTGTLALKLLHHAGSDEAFRLKREFRTLSLLAHPNLVVLHELFADEAGAAFTMEHVQGSDFLAYVRAGGALDVARVRPVVLQLLEGLSWLHGAGVIHRDLKPSNVLVSDEGRAVLLDFGVALAGPENDVSGTARFMAPEQATGRSVPASDLFALGVMLELALATPGAHHDATRARDVDELRALAARMKHTDPARRPSADELLRELGGRPRARVADGSSAFVGRERELAELTTLAQGARTRARVIYVEAPSGYGKSTLVAEFIHRLKRTAPTPLVLRGRCCRRETVRNRALDPLFDALSDELRQATPELLAKLSACVTRHLLELVPVLERVPAFALHKEVGPLLADARERRAAALAGLRKLLGVLAATRPLVMCIDDVHWLDEESLQLMRELLPGADVPGVLWICAGRPVDAHGPARERHDPARARDLQDALVGAEFHQLTLGPLAAADTLTLARTLLRGRDELAARAAAMSAGSPLMLTQLSELALESRSMDHDAGLERVVERRISSLPAFARQTLEVVTLWGEPAAVELLCEAASASRTELECALNLLEAQLYVRSTTTSPVRVEPSHDQIAELVQRAIPAEKRRHVHRNIAAALAREGEDASRARSLWFHYREAGDVAQALRFAEIAALGASERLSFLEAAALFAECVALTGDSARRAHFLSARAEALVNAGRDHEAAPIVRALAEAASSPEQRFALARRAAELFFRAGYANEAMSLLEPWLRKFDLRPRNTRLGAAASFLYHRARLWASMPSAADGPTTNAGQVQRDRVELCLVVAQGMGLGRGHILPSIDYVSRLAIHVRRGATEEQFVRALSLEAALQAIFAPSSGRAEALLTRAGELCAVAHDPVLHGRVQMVAGLCALFRLDRPAMHGHAQRAMQLFESHGRGVHTELATARWMWHLARFGKGADIVPEMENLVLDAVQRADRTTEKSARICLAVAALANGDAQRARREADAADALTGHKPREAVHWISLATRARIDMYEGAPERAYRQLRRAVHTMKWAGFLLAPWTRIELKYLLAIAGLECDRRDTRRCAQSIADELAAESLLWPRLLARQLHAALLALRGERARAAAELTETAEALEREGGTWYAWGSLLLAHRLRGAGSPAPVLALARGRGSPEPERFLAAYAPLFCPRAPARAGASTPRSHTDPSASEPCSRAEPRASEPCSSAEPRASEPCSSAEPRASTGPS